MKEIEKAAKASLVLICGDEAALRREALRDLLEAAEIDPTGFEHAEMVAGEASVGDWIGSVTTAPFLAERRSVVVRQIYRLEPDQVPDAAIQNLPETAFVVLVGDEETSEARMERIQRTLGAAWIKKVKALKGVVIECKADPGKIAEQLRERSESQGKKLAPATAQMLAEMTGKSLSRGVDELDKLILFVGDEPEIRAQDVKSVVVPSREWNVFAMIDAIFGGNVKEALGQMQTLTGSAKKAPDAAFSSILPNLSRNLKLIWQGRVMIDAGARSDDLPSELLVAFPERPNLLKESPYRRGRVMEIARKVDLATLSRCFRLLADTDAALKGMETSFSPNDQLEQLVLKMSDLVSPSRRV